MSRCLHGLDVVVGAQRAESSEYVLLGSYDVLGGGTKYLVMHIDNPKGLVEKEKGKGMAWLTSTLVPDFVENKIYDEVSKKLKEEFKAKGSTVRVEITEAPPKGAAPSRDLLTGMAVGGGVATLGYFLFRLLTHTKKTVRMGP